jgi:Ca2+-binding EF-hand superfamily protein
VCDFNARRQEVLARYDANGNGQLEREEARRLRADLAPLGRGPSHMGPGRFGEGMRPHSRGQAFGRVRWAFDEDGDGALSTEERAALVDALQARCQRRYQQALERFDANQDGQLDEAERQAAREAARAAFEARRQELLAQYDTDGNGVLDAEERMRLHEERMAAARARRQELLAQYDTDGDGTLSTEEALPLRKEIQRRIIEGPDDQP